MSFRYCPQCAAPLQLRPQEGIERLACSAQGCSFVHWENPTPVVAAIVEHEGKIVLARNAAWPQKFYALVTGFLEKHDPSPEEAAIREVEEELNLRGQAANFVGHYRFERMNQLIIAFHVPAVGEIRLSEELVDYRCERPENVRYWPAATGLALRDWLRGRGYDPQPLGPPDQPY